jgi:hypothetical protein
VRWLVGVLALGLLAVGCEQKTAPTTGITPRQESALDSVTYLWPQVAYKDFRVRDIKSAAQCEDAGFSWISHPRHAERFPDEQGCYRFRSGPLSDSGKLCESQADCVGNCLVEKGSVISTATCQKDQAEPDCAFIREGAELYSTGCVIVD